MNLLLPQWPLVARGAQVEAFVELLRARQQGGVLVFGAAGVGKTRLANEFRRIAEREGYPTERLAGSETTSSLPLAAAAPLLPAASTNGQLDPATGLVSVFEAAAQQITDRHGERQLVVLADDVNKFDAASLALVSFLVGRDALFLVGTIRTGDPVPDLLTALWRDRRLARVDVAELDREGFDTLLHIALGGPVEAGARLQLWNVSQGNPLYARELMMEALEHGQLAERDGVWHLRGLVSRTDRLADLVAERMGNLDPDATSVIELLALCQPLPVDYVAGLAGIGLLERLEESGRVAVALDRNEVSLGHPLFADVIRPHIPSLRARSVYRREAERLESQTDMSRADRLRSAEWRLRADGRADAAVLVDAAQVARFAHDFRSVRRFVEAMPAADRGPQAGLLLGEALYELGAFDESERVLSAVDGSGLAEDMLLRVVVARTKNLQWGICDSVLALAVNQDGRSHLASPALLDELTSNEAAIRMFSGSPLLALEAIENVKADDARGRAVRAIVQSPALACMGRTTEAIAVAEAGFAEHVRLGDDIAIAHPGTHIVNQVFSLTEAGRLEEASLLAKAGAEIAATDRVPIAQIWFALNLGRISLLEGKTATARRYYAEGTGLAEANHFAGPMRLALAGLATACSLLGDVAAADAALRRQSPLPAFGFLKVEALLGRAWWLAAGGEPVRAAEVFTEAAVEAAATGHLTSEAWLLHDQLRACARTDTARLEELAGLTDSALTAARARHAVARRDGNADELVAAAEDFAALGANLLAAEALASATDAYRRTGDQRTATATARRSSVLAEKCEGSRSPDLLLRTDAVSPLSDRERDVALLAAAGVPSKEIAARLYLSVRTVNNHLQRAYTKLGVSSRAGLALALEDKS